MDLENQVKQYIIAEIQLAYWLNQRRQLGTLISPRTDWEVTKYRALVATKFASIVEQIDIIIPTQKLYTDLYESA